MIRIEGRAAVYGEVWYEEELPRDSEVDIVLYRQRENPIADARTTPFLTMVTDLSAEADAIAEKFGKDCRYKIRRAETKDGLRMEFITEPESRLDEFRAFYDAFARQKSVAPSYHQWLLGACKARQLVLTSASQNGEALVWRANRWLHWKEMLQFKEMGLKRYDWGGLFEDESVPENAGINRFKKDFGGQQVRTYDCTLPVTIRGRLWLPLRDAWRRRIPPSRPRAGSPAGILLPAAPDEPRAGPARGRSAS